MADTQNNFRIFCHDSHGDYIDEKLQPLGISRGCKKEKEASLTEDERTLFRTILMKLVWLARRCRPDIIGSCMMHPARPIQVKCGRPLAPQKKTMKLEASQQERAENVEIQMFKC